MLAAGLRVAGGAWALGRAGRQAASGAVAGRAAGDYLPAAGAPPASGEAVVDARAAGEPRPRPGGRLMPRVPAPPSPPRPKTALRRSMLAGLCWSGHGKCGFFLLL